MIKLNKSRALSFFYTFIKRKKILKIFFSTKKKTKQVCTEKKWTLPCAVKRYYCSLHNFKSKKNFSRHLTYSLFVQRF